MLQLDERLDADRLEYVSILSGVGLPYLEAFDEDSKQLLRNCIEYLWYDVIMVQDMRGLEFPPIGKLQLNQFEHWRRDPSLVNTVALLHSGEYSYSDRMERIDEYYAMPADIGKLMNAVHRGHWSVMSDCPLMAGSTISWFRS